jgi:hypothetical protein
MLSHWLRHGLAALALPVLSAAGAAQSLETTFTADNCHDGNMFDLVALKPLTVSSFDVHFQNTLDICGVGCSVVEVVVYRTTNGQSYQGNEQNPGVWTLVGSVQHTVTTPAPNTNCLAGGTGGPSTPQPLNLPLDLPMDPAGVARYGMYVTNTGFINNVTGNFNERINYTTGNGGNQNYDNGDMRIETGAGLAYPFNIGGNGVWDDRVWNGRVHYSLAGGCSSNAVSYCTAGTSASGCNGLLSSTGVASASAGSGFDVTLSAAEGAKDGLFFYGQNGRQANPWGNGSSLQCVVTPVRRGGLQAGLGTGGACDGGFTQDLNARWCGACTHPGHQPTVGQKLQIQAWYRDPFNTSNQTTSLSDALEVDVCP